MNIGGSTAGFSSASALTRAEILDHARDPRNRGELQDADIVQEEANPLCGDVVTMYAKLDQTNSRLQALSFTGSGCLISQAAASMLTERASGKSLAEIRHWERAEVEALIGGALSPARVKCAMLPLIALQHGLRQGISSPS